LGYVAKRAELVITLEPGAGHPGELARRFGLSRFSLATSLTARPQAVCEVMSCWVAVPLAERLLVEIAGQAGVREVRLGRVEDIPPDDEPPAGVREPRGPRPSAGSGAADQAAPDAIT
jgi:hypothetical protein